MSDASHSLSNESSSAAAPPIAKTLRTLFLTLFLRGRSARGLQKDKAPKTVGERLTGTLLVYGLVGLLALSLHGQPVFLLSAYLHALTFVFLGMFIASSSGEVLFNREEAEILLHRPIPVRLLLWSKIRVIVEVSIWLAFTFNLAGFFVGLAASDGSWRFPFVHALSTVMMTLFCTASVVLIYELCLRWFGREWLDGIMTAAQVILSVAAVVAGQVVPQLLFHIDETGVSLSRSWWPVLLPPVWFAGVDDVLSSAPDVRSIVCALLAVTATGLVLWLSYDKLSDSYQTGLQLLSETKTRVANSSNDRRFLERLVDAVPFKWWLRDPVVRSSFLMTTAYLVRDRDVKLRIYPGLAPFMMFPVIMVVQGLRSDGAHDGGFMLAFVCGYASIIPMLALDMLKYSQNWQAADIFRAVPQHGPARIFCGARRAVLCFTVVPVVVILGVSFAVGQGNSFPWLLMVATLMPLPVFAIVPHALGKAIPLSQPPQEAKTAGRGLAMVGAMFVAIAFSVVASVANATGWLREFVLVEVLVVAGVYWLLHVRVSNANWESLE